MKHDQTDIEEAGAAEAPDEDFEKFLELRKSNQTFFLASSLGFFACIVTLLSKTISLLLAPAPKRGDSIIALSIITGSLELLLSVDILLLILVFETYSPRKEGFLTKIARKFAPFEDILKSFAVLCTTAYFSILVNAKVWMGECYNENNFFGGMFCTESSSSLSADVTIGLVFFPLVICCILRDVRFEIMLLSWLFTVLALLISCSALKNFLRGLMPLLVVSIGLLIVYCELHRQCLSMYLLSNTMQRTLLHQNVAEESGEKDATAVSDMRTAVANVAHDLKTPLASFLSGLDVISALLNDAQEQQQPQQQTQQQLIEPIRSCIEDIRCTNNFMIMAINRCIDYSKASAGFKLTPKLETIDFFEALRFPVRIIQNLQQQQRQEITLQVLPTTELCSHVITDKQWLQENLLCLLSNAVKYSNKGRIDVTVSLVSQHEVAAQSIDVNNSRSRSNSSGAESVNSRNSSTAAETPAVMAAAAVQPTSLRVKPRTPLVVQFSPAANAGSRSSSFRISNVAASNNNNNNNNNNSSSNHQQLQLEQQLEQLDLSMGATSPFVSAAISRSNSIADLSLVTSSKSPSVKLTAAALASIFANRVNNQRRSSRIATETSFSVYLGASADSERRMLQQRNSRRSSGFFQGESSSNLLDTAGAVASPRLQQKQQKKQQRLDEESDDVHVFEICASSGAVAASKLSSPRQFRSNMEEGMADTEQGSTSVGTFPVSVAPAAVEGDDFNRIGNIEPVVNIFQQQEQKQQQLQQQQQSRYFSSSADRVRSLDRGPHLIKIEVQDMGTGLSEEAMRQVHRPFSNQQQQQQMLYSSTELGVYSFAKRIEALGGYYEARQRSDGVQGSIFWFAFPYQPDHIAAELKQEHHRQPHQQQEQQQQPPSALNILVVNNSPVQLKYTRILLQKRGHRVVSADNSAVALELILQQHRHRIMLLQLADDRTADTLTAPTIDAKTGEHTVFDVVLMEVMMHDLNGIEALKRLRAEERVLSTEFDRLSIIAPVNDVTSDSIRCSSINNSSRSHAIHQLVIASTSNSCQEVRDDLLNAGVDGFMENPFSINKFNSIMQQIR